MVAKNTKKKKKNNNKGERILYQDHYINQIVVFYIYYNLYVAFNQKMGSMCDAIHIKFIRI